MAKLKNIGAGLLVLPKRLGQIAPGEEIVVDDGVLEIPGVASWIKDKLAEEVKPGRKPKPKDDDEE